LLRLSRLLYRPDYEETARRLFGAFALQIGAYPTGHSHLLSAYLTGLLPSRDVVVVADKPPLEVQQAVLPLSRVFAPEASFIYVLRGEEFAKIREAVPFTKEMQPKGTDVTFYVCKGFACEAPITSVDEVRSLLEETSEV